MNRICAAIITYNPNIDRLERSICSIYPQIELLVIIDNGSQNCDMINKLIVQYQKIKIIRNENNLGIATALNQALNYAVSERMEWLLTLDQDSVCPEKIIKEYSDVADINNIGIITLMIVKNNGQMINPISEPYTEVERCITSGSLMNVKVLKELGGYDDRMFIDWVDHDICKRMRLANYKIIRVNSLYLNHELGPQTNIEFTVLLHKIFHTRIIKKPHSADRMYFYIRNGIYYIRKYKKEMNKKEKRYTIYELLMAIRRSIFLGHGKIKYIKKITKGFLDGFNMLIER